MAYVHPKDAETLCLTQDGRVVAESDPAAAFVLIAGGGTLSDADARKHGLTAGSRSAAVVAAGAEENRKQGAGPKENKLAQPATEDKEPLPGYDGMTVEQVLAELEPGDLSAETLAAIRAYETAGKQRKGILEAL